MPAEVNLREVFKGALPRKNTETMLDDRFGIFHDGCKQFKILFVASYHVKSGVRISVKSTRSRISSVQWQF